MPLAENLSILLVPLILAAAFIIISLVCLPIISYRNNLEETMPSKAEFQAAFEKAILWMLDHQKETYVHNLFLWLFIREAAQRSGNTELLEIVDKYRETRKQQGGKRDLWYLVENKGEEITYNPVWFETMVHYAQAIVYGLTGNKELGKSEFIQEQLKPDFSAAETAKDIRSSCLTHQIMGLHYIQVGGYCGDPKQYQPLMTNLQAQVRELLTRDPRVGDVYLQRVLMLVWTGARDQVKPIWFRRILERQRKDGGWFPFHNLGWLAPGLRLGMGLNLIRLKRDKTTFHTTAQGLFLMALMCQDSDSRIV